MIDFSEPMVWKAEHDFDGAGRLKLNGETVLCFYKLATETQPFGGRRGIGHVVRACTAYDAARPGTINTRIAELEKTQDELVSMLEVAYINLKYLAPEVFDSAEHEAAFWTRMGDMAAIIKAKTL